MKYRLKIVPDATPDADGRWIEVDVADDARAPQVGSWSAAALYLTRHIPKGEHLVAYERASEIMTRAPWLEGMPVGCLIECLHERMSSISTGEAFTTATEGLTDDA